MRTVGNYIPSLVISIYMPTNSRDVSEKSSQGASYDRGLWQKVMEYSKGSTDEKIKAISIIFSQHRKLPPTWLDIVGELASEKQPRK